MYSQRQTLGPLQGAASVREVHAAGALTRTLGRLWVQPRVRMQT